MAAPTFTALVGDLRTGRITNRLPLTGCTWQQGGAGSISGAVVNVNDALVAALDPYHTAAPPKAFLCLQYDNTILAGGPIWTHRYTRSAGTVTMGAGPIESIFDHRPVLPVMALPLAIGAAQTAVTTYPTGSNMSLGDIAVALVTQALTHTGGNLPIVFPAAQGKTPGATRTYPGYDLSVVGAMLAELSAIANGGPEIAFRPRIKASDPGYVEWVMLVGTPAQPLLTQGGADWVFDASAPKSMVSDIDVDVDATGMGTRQWVTGSGTGTGIMLSQADSVVLTSAGYPLLENTDATHNNVTVQATLDNYATQDLTQGSRPDAIWKLRVRNDGAPADPLTGVPWPNMPAGPKLGQYQKGDYVQVVVGPGPYLPPGRRRARLLQIDGDLGQECTLTLATMSAEV
jgi:hypothetical protein